MKRFLMEKDKLNLGCGKNILEGYKNCDCINGKGIDRVANLNKYPWPFKENSFKEIIFDSVLEHIDNPEKAIREVWRISKKNGITRITVPHFSCWQAWGDITHKRPFNSTSLFSFSDKNTHRKSSSLLNSQKEIFDISTKITFGKIKRGLLFERIFNINNFSRGFYERNIAYILPAENIVFNIRAIKK